MLGTHILPSRSGFAVAVCLSVFAFAPEGPAMAAQDPFGSRAEAEAYLARELPIATAANPKYLTKSDGVESVWLTKSVHFETATTGVRVTMEETYAQTKGGVTTPGTHEAAFALAEVEISIVMEPGDVTPAGEPAMGLLFTCAKPGCIAAKWGGQPSLADKTDVSLQDAEARERILAAFRYLRDSGA